MLLYVNQLVTNVVCLTFDAGQVVRSGFLKTFCENDADYSGEIEKTRAEGGCRVGT